MEWVVTTAKTVDDAKEAALDELGVDAADAEFEILEEPRQGLFGRQRGEARVRARVRPTAPRPKVERGRRRKKSSDGDDESNARSTTAEPAPRAVEADKPAKATGGRARMPKAAPSAVAAIAADAQEDDAGEEASPAARPRRRRSASSSAATANGSPGVDRPDEPQHRGDPMVEEELTLEAQGQIAGQFVTGLLQKFDLAATLAVVTLDEETVEVQVSGADLGLLIGPKGQTLQAVQELTRTAVQRRSVARTGRILVDVAEYRVKRREALERFTRQVADDVRSSGVQRVLEPMSPADRKIVHDTAGQLDGVRTLSEGEEPRRRVVIIPDRAATAEAADDDGA